VPEEINQPYGKMKIPHLEVSPNPEASFDEPIAKRTGEKEIGILFNRHSLHREGRGLRSVL